MKKTLIITHNDLDGIMSGAIAKYYIGAILDRVEVICEGNPSSSMTNDIIMKYIDLYDEFYILDRASATIDIDKPVYHIDHHRDSSNKYTVSHSLDCSATLLTYNYFDKNNENEIVKRYAELTSLYDTWKWNGDKNSVDSKLCLSLNNIVMGGKLDPTELISKFMGGISVDKLISNSTDILKMLKRIEEDYIDKKIKTIKVIDFYGYRAAWCTCELYLSQIADKYLREHDGVDMFIGYNAEYPSLSFRTRKDNVDILSLSRRFGGNGHTKACGCPVTKENSFFITEGFKEHRDDIGCTNFKIEDYTSINRKHPIFNIEDEIQYSMEFKYAGDEYYCVLDVCDILDDIKYKGVEINGVDDINDIIAENNTDDLINKLIDSGDLDLDGRLLTTLIIYKNDEEVYVSYEEVKYDEVVSMKASAMVGFANGYIG